MTKLDIPATATDVFEGFQPLDANFLHCPNQFFDVGLRHCSRGEIRLVAYFVFQSYRLLGDDGTPNTDLISLTHADLREACSVSVGAFDKSIEQCLRMRFIDGNRARGKGEYQVRLSENPTTNPTQFDGFYSGAGRWSPIPHQFFTYVIPNYTLAEIRVAGAVLRHTVGFEQKLGIRRKHHPLSVDYLQQYTMIRDRKTLTDAIAKLEGDNIIECVERGIFHPASDERRPTIYGPKWNAPKARMTDESGVLSKTQPATNFQKPNQRDLSFSQPVISKTQPEKTFKNPTNIKAIPLEKTNNRQADADVVASDYLVNLLRKHGVGENVARRLSTSHPRQQIEDQVAWLQHRNASDPAAMLVRSIEENFSQPATVNNQEQQEQAKLEADERKRRRLEQLEAHEAELQAAEQAKQAKHQRWLSLWSPLPVERKRAYYQSVERTANSFTRRMLQAKNYDHPPQIVLQAMVADLEATLAL